MPNWKHLAAAAATAAIVPTATFVASHPMTLVTGVTTGLVFVAAFCAAMMKGLGQS